MSSLVLPNRIVQTVDFRKEGRTVVTLRRSAARGPFLSGRRLIVAALRLHVR